MGTDRPGVTRPSWLAEPHERQRVGCVETLVTVFGFWLPGAGGFDSGRSFVAARLNRLRGEDAHVLAQPALFWWKLVEPACERQRVGRVETMVTLSGVLWSGFGCRVWGGFDSAVRFAHVLAQPASAGSALLPNPGPLPSLRTKCRRRTVQRRVATLNRRTSAIHAQQGGMWAMLLGLASCCSTV